MKFAIVASKKDIAGINIVKELKLLGCKTPVYFVDEEAIYLDNLDKAAKIDADFIVFASKHQSVKKVKTLTIHAIGNWKKADFGGKDFVVCMTSALILKYFFQELYKQTQDSNLNNEYHVSLEATHHGPFLTTPCLFIEVGSSESEWKDKKACKVIAETIIKSTSTINQINDKIKIGIGIGGPHYCPNFNKIQLDNHFAISHIIAEYALPIDKEMINQAILKTREKVEYAIIDWKGLGNSKQRQETLKVLQNFNLKIIRTSEAKTN